MGYPPGWSGPPLPPPRRPHRVGFLTAFITFLFAISTVVAWATHRPWALQNLGVTVGVLVVGIGLRAFSLSIKKPRPPRDDRQGDPDDEEDHNPYQ